MAVDDTCVRLTLPADCYVRCFLSGPQAMRHIASGGVKHANHRRTVSTCPPLAHDHGMHDTPSIFRFGTLRPPSPTLGGSRSIKFNRRTRSFGSTIAGGLDRNSLCCGLGREMRNSSIWPRLLNCSLAKTLIEE